MKTLSIHERRARFLFRAAGTVFILMGAGHGLAALVDVFVPTVFTPVDDRVRQMMIGAPIRLSSHSDLWRAWLGFNLSHSLGVVFFGIAAWIVTSNGIAALRRGPALPMALAMSCSYFVLSSAFWFYAPTIGAALGSVLFGISGILARREVSQPTR